MATTVTCDKCRTKIKTGAGLHGDLRFIASEPTNYPAPFTMALGGQIKYSPKTYDLCERCKNRLVRWLNESDPVTEP